MGFGHLFAGPNNVLQMIGAGSWTSLVNNGYDGMVDADISVHVVGERGIIWGRVKKTGTYFNINDMCQDCYIMQVIPAQGPGGVRLFKMVGGNWNSSYDIFTASA